MVRTPDDLRLVSVQSCRVEPTRAGKDIVPQDHWSDERASFCDFQTPDRGKFESNARVSVINEEKPLSGRSEQPHTTVHSFDNFQQTPETVYLLQTLKENVWIRSQICFQEKNQERKNQIYGLIEVQEVPEMASGFTTQRTNSLQHLQKPAGPVGIELYNKDGILIDINDKEKGYHRFSHESPSGMMKITLQSIKFILPGNRFGISHLQRHRRKNERPNRSRFQSR